MPLDLTTTLGDLVTEDFRRARVLEQFGLDYCCNGERSLADAAAASGLDAAQVAAALELAGPAQSQVAHGTGNRAALAHDIVDTHHAYMWAEMPRLRALVEKVHGVHGDRHPELARVKDAFLEALTALEPHMTTEERVIFPAITRLERTGVPLDSGSLAEPIRELRAEHDVVGQIFQSIRGVTDGYAVPGDACNSYRAMLKGLEEMELDLHEHIHKENNILFPKVLELEAEIASA